MFIFFIKSGIKAAFANQREQALRVKSKLQPRLLFNALQQITPSVLRQFPVDCHLTRFVGMPELAVACPIMMSQIPSVFLQDLDDS